MFADADVLLFFGGGMSIGWCCLSRLLGIVNILTYGAVWGLGRALIERRRPPTLTTA